MSINPNNHLVKKTALAVFFIYFKKPRGEKKKLFTETPVDSMYECIMTRIPNFRSRGGGQRISESDLENAILIISRTSVRIGAEAYREELELTVCGEKGSPPLIRNEKNIRKKGIQDGFQKQKAQRNIHHNGGGIGEKQFSSRRRLSFDGERSDAEPCISRNSIDFDSIKSGKYSVGTYALFCAAKDLYLGTDSMNIEDMSDRSVISDAAFGVICNAMMIKQYGMKTLGVVHTDEAKQTSCTYNGVGEYVEENAVTT